MYLAWFSVKVDDVFLKSVINKDSFIDKYVDIDFKVKIFYLEVFTFKNDSWDWC